MVIFVGRWPLAFKLMVSLGMLNLQILSSDVATIDTTNFPDELTQSYRKVVPGDTLLPPPPPPSALAAAPPPEDVTDIWLSPAISYTVLSSSFSIPLKV